VLAGCGSGTATRVPEPSRPLGHIDGGRYDGITANGQHLAFIVDGSSQTVSIGSIIGVDSGQIKMACEIRGVKADLRLKGSVPIEQRGLYHGSLPSRLVVNQEVQGHGVVISGMFTTSRRFGGLIFYLSSNCNGTPTAFRAHLVATR
jgi:hypothetical protein